MPSTATDRLNGLTTSVAIKAPCVCATTANITLSGLQTIDGVALDEGDRVLVKDQTDASGNGIYKAVSGSWVRATDFDGSLDVVAGTTVIITSGSMNGNTSWMVSAGGDIVFGSTSITFEPSAITGPAGTVTANSGVTTTWTTEVANTSATAAWHTLTAPTVAFTNSIGGSDKVSASIIANVGKFTQGPTGHANYFDTVIAFGLNMNQSYGPSNTTMPSASYRIESKFAQGGATDPFAVEFHTSMGSTDASSVEFRAVSCFVPHLKANWAVSAGVTLRGGQISLTDGSITPQVAGTERVKFDFRPGQNVINLGKNGSERAPGFSTDSNGVYVFRQINAAGNAFISLPFVNSDDMVETDAPTVVVGAAKSNATFGVTAFHVGQCTSLAVGGYLDFVVSQAATAGAAYGLFRQTNTSGTTTHKLTNLGAGATVLDVEGSTASGYLVNGVKVLGVRDTGWTAMTGSAIKTSIAAAAAGTASVGYVQAELQAALNRIAALEARMKGYDAALIAHGIIGA